MICLSLCAHTVPLYMLCGMPGAPPKYTIYLVSLLCLQCHFDEVVVVRGSPQGRLIAQASNARVGTRAATTTRDPRDKEDTVVEAEAWERRRGRMDARARALSLLL